VIRVAGCNLGLITRLLTGAGTPREFRARTSARLGVLMTPDGGLIGLIVVVIDDQIAFLAVSLQFDPFA
jgi:hypothetical protein